MPTDRGDAEVLIAHWRSYLETAARKYRQLRDGYFHYAENLIRSDLPVLFDFPHLSLVLEVEPRLLQEMIFATGNLYRYFEIPKRTGGVRKIEVPKPSLLAVQRWINAEILAKQPLDDSAIGFVAGHSVRDHARKHAEFSYLLKVDIKGFFPSIKRTRILRLFERIGYAPNVAFFLSRLVTLNEALPQGAATSPALANIVATSLDKRVASFSQSLGLCYSRYADDLAISGEIPLGHFHAECLRAIINDEGFEMNDNKTRWYGPTEVKRLVGLSVRNGTIRVPRSFRREVKQQVHYIEKFGLEGHIEHFENPDVISAERLVGKLAYWSFIEPESEQPKALSDRLSRALK